MDEQFVSIGKAAKMLGMSIEGLRKWEREGRLIPVRTVTNHRRYRVANLHALMQENGSDPTRDTRCMLPPAGISDMRESPRKNKKTREIWIANWAD